MIFVPAAIFLLTQPGDVQAAELSLSAEYEELRAFHLQDGAVRVENFTLKRDRVEIRLTGEIFFARPVMDRVTGAVFLGEGRVKTEPWSDFERSNLRRILKADVIDAGFRTAVLRFTDDTF